MRVRTTALRCAPVRTAAHLLNRPRRTVPIGAAGSTAAKRPVIIGRQARAHTGPHTEIRGVGRLLHVVARGSAVGRTSRTGGAALAAAVTARSGPAGERPATWPRTRLGAARMLETRAARALHELGRQPELRARRRRDAALGGRGAGGRAGRRDRVRCVGAGHSFTPLHETAGTLLRTDALHGIVRIDAAAGRVVALPGDHDRRRSASRCGTPGWRWPTRATSTPRRSPAPSPPRTHGSGLGLPSFSATLRRLRLVLASGDVVEIGEDDPRLPAAQVAIGHAGRDDRARGHGRPRPTAMAERIEHWTWDEAFGRFDEMARAHRHFSFFWCPSEELGGAVRPDRRAGARNRRHLLRQDLRRGRRRRAGLDGPGARVGRPYTIYPAGVRAELPRARVLRARTTAAREAIAAMRELMLAPPADRRLPDGGAHGRGARTRGSRTRTAARRVVISVSGQPGTDYEPYLREVRRAARRLRRARALGQAALPDPRRSCCERLPARGRLHRRAARARPRRRSSSTTTCGRCSPEAPVAPRRSGSTDDGPTRTSCAAHLGDNDRRVGSPNS